MTKPRAESGATAAGASTGAGWRRLTAYPALAGLYAAQYWKGLMAYRADFWAGLATDLAHQGASLLVILVLFTQVPAVRGWSREEMIFVYGYFLVPFSLFHASAANLWDFAERYVVHGELDRLLLRPLPVLFQVLLETIELEALPGLGTGVVLMAWAGARLDLHPSPVQVLAVPLLVAASVCVYYGIFVAVASHAFWADGRTGLVPLLWNLNHYGRYPTDIYGGVLRFLLTWVLPMGFVGFFPAAALLRPERWWTYGLLAPLVGGGILFLGLLVWRAGLRRYQGAGS